MKIHHISHACHLLQEGNSKILFDPVFFQFSKTPFRLFPNVKVDVAKITGMKIDAIFISHFHEDHFCLRSLARFDRDIPVYFYGDLHQERNFLQAIGFKTVKPLKLGKSVKIGEFQVTPLDNAAAASECLFQIRSRSANVLNGVDAVLTPKQRSKINLRGPYDVALFPFQELNQSEMVHGSHAFGLNEAKYLERLRWAAALDARLIVPSSCEIEYRVEKCGTEKHFQLARPGFAMI